jgi:hypothetical protein
VDTSKFKIVYHITENKGKSYWTRVGVAFVNRDDSLNVKLDVLPIDGKLHIRDYVPREGSTVEADETSEPETTSDASTDDDFSILRKYV